MNALANHFARDRRKALAWAIGTTVAVALAIGGVLAGSALAGGSPGNSSGQATTLNAALSTAGNTSAGAGHRLGAVARLRRLGGMYGQFSYRTKTGATRTLAFERGVVSAAGTDLVVRAANGTTWTWQFAGSTVVRKGGGKVGRSDLTGGEQVLVAGPVTAGARDARLVVIRGARKPAPGATPAPSTPAPSTSASTAAVTSTN